ncbi:hypothetical protein QBC43DRAFT_304992 [Cladorrhinum sp. PSN259]|nr:hypothetical protein QBC43DRAFT_304992 [Cladorrhinum sp. PSN259]
MIGNDNNNLVSMEEYLSEHAAKVEGAANGTSKTISTGNPVALTTANSNVNSDFLIDKAHEALLTLMMGMMEHEQILIRDRFMQSLNTAEGHLNSNPADGVSWLIVQSAALDAKCDHLERRQEAMIKGACAELIQATVNDLMQAPDNKKIKSINARINDLERQNGTSKKNYGSLRNEITELKKAIFDLKRVLFAQGISTTNGNANGNASAPAVKPMEEANKKRKASDGLATRVVLSRSEFKERCDAMKLTANVENLSLEARHGSQQNGSSINGANGTNESIQAADTPMDGEEEH